MRRPLLPLALSALLVGALLLPAPADARTKRKKRAKRTARTPVTRPYYGPPAPTPLPLLRAAGACMEFTPGQHLVVAEIGATGRFFRIDAETKVEAEVRKGARVRVLYVDGPEGPLARRILPGPVAATPSPKAP